MFNKFFERRKKRVEAVNKAREGFLSWLEISNSLGWKTYQERIDKKMGVVKNRIESDTALTGEDLKRLQLALQVWKEVLKIPKELEDIAKGGVK